MGPKPIWKRAAALLAAVGMLIFLAGGISADDEIAEAEPAAALQPTQVVAEIPEEYNTPFQLQWGGGSLYQLKARLATMGCLANNVWVYNNKQWALYNQYTLPQDTFFIQQFKQQYEQFIPAGVLHADCYRMCEFTRTRPQHEWHWLFADIEHNTQHCLSYEYLRERNFYIVAPPVSETTPCNDNFDPRIIEYVFPILPVHPDVCIVRQQIDRDGGISGQVAFTTLNSIPVVLIYDGVDVYRNTAERDTILLKKEIHELCHINQVWQWIQSIHLDINRPAYYWRYEFENSPQAQEFISLVNLTQFGSAWRLPRDSVYRDIYAKNPAELSAELCTMYLLDKMGERSSYDYETYSGGQYWEIPIRTIDVNTYLTPEVREWLETYMILPDVENTEEDIE